MGNPVDPGKARHARSFGRGAAEYERARPSYPDAAVDWAVPPGAREVLDLAAGTGKLTRQLVDRGLQVTAVEPSDGMRELLSAALPDVQALPGTAERTGLPEASVDLVTVGQAWHWFDVPAATTEIARVLRPGGTLAVLWNVRDTARDWVAAFAEILSREQTLPDPVHELRLGPPFGAVEHRRVRWLDRVDPTDLRVLAASRSHLLVLTPERRDELLGAVDELARTHPELRGRDRVELPYVTDCWRAVTTPVDPPVTAPARPAAR